MNNNTSDYLNKITRHLAIHAQEVSLAVAQHRYDINTISETVLAPVLRIALNLPDLKNLNTIQQNYPAIDLADDTKSVCIQITSETSQDKVEKTIKKFIKHDLYKKYSKLIVYHLTPSKQNYNQSSITKATGGKFTFDVKKDILDYKNLSKLIGTFQVDELRLIFDILEANFNRGKFPVSTLDKRNDVESLFLNCIPITITGNIFLANINAPEATIKTTMRSLPRKLSGAWVVNEKKIFTFSDLNEQDHPLRNFIDIGTIEDYSPEDICEMDQSYMNIFKYLLRLSVKNIVAQQNVSWQKEADLFIFTPNKIGEEVRFESWKGKKNTTRTVYKKSYKKQDPKAVLNHKHFGFRCDFFNVENNWYMSIKPEWFISYDGYKKDFYAGKSVRYLKQRERNSNVFNHIRFLNFFLINSNKQSSEPIIFGKLLEFSDIKKFIEPKWDVENSPQVEEEYTDEDLEVLN